jgi:hypothetical protein
MAVIDTLRPVSFVYSHSNWTTTPSGTVVAVVGDDNVSTYASRPAMSSGDAKWNTGTHTPPADHERHRVRGRAVMRTPSGFSTNCNIQAAFPGDSATGVLWAPITSVPITTSFTEVAAGWLSSGSNGGVTLEEYLADPSPKAFGVYVRPSPSSSGSTIATLDVAEIYLDIDCRAKPTFTADVLDGAGNSKASDVIDNTSTPTFTFDSVALDGLPARLWRLTILSGGTPVYETTVNGAAPAAHNVPLVNGSYTARFEVASTIRGSEAFWSDPVEIDFEVQVPISPPANITTEVQGSNVVICWQQPGGESPWGDPSQVTTHIERTDCTGTHVVGSPKGTSGCFTDRTATFSRQGRFCGEPDHECQVSYRLRYEGYINAVVGTEPAPIPEGIIFAWPGANGDIPEGWERETSLDGRYPVGEASSGAAGATFGASTHMHTTPGHYHGIADHTHASGGTSSTYTGTGVASLDPDPSTPLTTNYAASGHTHTLPATLGVNTSGNSGTAAPDTSSESNLVTRKEYIFISSDGTESSLPVGGVGLYHSSSIPTGFAEEDTDETGNDTAYLRGAGTGQNGSKSKTTVWLAHSHTVDSHTHTGVTHNHGWTGQYSGGSTSTFTRRDPKTVSGSSNMVAAWNGHAHIFASTSTLSGTLQSASGVTAPALRTEPSPWGCSPRPRATSR